MKKDRNRIKEWLIGMSSVGMIGVTTLGIINPEKYGRQLQELTFMVVTAVITLAKQESDPEPLPVNELEAPEKDGEV